MKTHQKKNSVTGTSSILRSIPGLDIKDEKVESYSDDIVMGACNYALFQKYSSFRWPAWVCCPGKGGSSARPDITPPILINTKMRDTLPCPVIPGNSELCIDPSGMIYPESSGWSIEIWVYSAGRIHRPSENPGGTEQNVDPGTGITRSTWKSRLFTIDLSFYTSRAPLTGAIVEAAAAVPARSAGAFLMCVIRPYDGRRLGGAGKIIYNQGSGQVRINGENWVSIVAEPDFVLSGSAEHGDISDWMVDPENAAETTAVECGSGMATMAFCYRLKKSGRSCFFRIAQGAGDMPVNARDLCVKAREALELNADTTVSQGIEIKLPDDRIMNWFRGAGNTLKQVSDRDLFIRRGRVVEPDYRSIYYIISALCVMGSTETALDMINRFLDTFTIDRKKPALKPTIDLCYMLIAVAEYYLKTRDADFLQSRYDLIRDLARVLMKKSSSIKGDMPEGYNSIREYAGREGHAYDLLLMAYALEQVAYCSRSMGIFGEEARVRGEAERLSSLFTGMLNQFCTDTLSPVNDFSFFLIYAGYPFRLRCMGDDLTAAMLERVSAHFSDTLLFVKSLGCDIVSSLVMTNNLILMEDQGAYKIIEKLMKIGEGRYHLPEYINPVSGLGCWGRGHSRCISSLVIATIRNIFFMDRPERLVLFPLPREEWFTPGTEIIIRNAQSRFGQINLRVISTTNEIQFHFEGLPRFVPPDILINLPVRAKIYSSDDFLIKNAEKQSFLINGWPSVIRFIRK